MAELPPKALLRAPGTPWVNDEEVESFLLALDAAFPINIVGGSSDLAERMAKSRPDLRFRMICPSPAGQMREYSSPTADFFLSAPDLIAPLLLPRSRTLLIDPFLASSLLDAPQFWRSLSLKTFEWVLAPLFVRPEPFTIFSDEFSFIEPLFDDVAPPWCWSVNSGPATVWVIGDDEVKTCSLSFTLTGASPGTFEIRLANATLRQEVTAGNLAARFRLHCRLERGANSLTISFDGQPFRPAKTADQRDALHFCFAAVDVASTRYAEDERSFPVPDIAARRDRAIRRFLHECGFFEIQTIARFGSMLSHLTGLRSCFDYREGFRLRDYGRFSGSVVTPRSSSQLPAAWYYLRKTPTPGSEWETSRQPCLERPIVVDWTAQAESTEAGILRDLLETRNLLLERTAQLECAAKDLAARDVELVEARNLLIERTAHLEHTVGDLVARDAELVETRNLLVERTAALERIARVPVLRHRVSANEDEVGRFAASDRPPDLE